MPAKVTKSAEFPETAANPIAFARIGRRGSGVVFVDAAGQTVIGASMSPSGSPSGLLKPVLVETDGKLSRCADRAIKWPLRVAPKDHIVTFQNEE